MQTKSKKLLPITIYIEQDQDGIFVGSVPSVPSCYAQGKTQEEMLKNLKQVLKLCLRNTDIALVKKNRFVGIQNFEIPYAQTYSNKTQKIYKNS